MEIVNVFQCKMCGQCCVGEGGIVVTEEEINNISNFLKLSTQEFEKTYTKEEATGKKAIKCDHDGFCIFFKQDFGCSIHPVKPNICKAWPFFKGNLLDKNSFEMAKDYCPGIKKDIKFEEFKKIGLKFLKENGLLNNSTSGPNALFFDQSKE